MNFALTCPMRPGIAAVSCLKLRAAEVAARVQELRVIEHVEEFHANQKGRSFGNSRAFLHTQVGLQLPRPMEEIRGPSRRWFPKPPESTRWR
jgi:hypothetical protein